MNKILGFVNLTLFLYCLFPFLLFAKEANADSNVCVLSDRSEGRISVLFGENWRCENNRLYREFDLSSFSPLDCLATSSASLSGEFIEKRRMSSYPNYLSFDEMVGSIIEFGVSEFGSRNRGWHEIYPLIVQGKPAKILFQEGKEDDRFNEYASASLFVDVSKESMIRLNGSPLCVHDEQLEDVYSEIVEIQKSVRF